MWNSSGAQSWPPAVCAQQYRPASPWKMYIAVYDLSTLCMQVTPELASLLSSLHLLLPHLVPCASVQWLLICIYHFAYPHTHVNTHLCLLEDFIIKIIKGHRDRGMAQNLRAFAALSRIWFSSPPPHSSSQLPDKPSSRVSDVIFWSLQGTQTYTQRYI